MWIGAPVQAGGDQVGDLDLIPAFVIDRDLNRRIAGQHLLRDQRRRRRAPLRRKTFDRMSGGIGVLIAAEIVEQPGIRLIRIRRQLAH